MFRKSPPRPSHRLIPFLVLGSSALFFSAVTAMAKPEWKEVAASDLAAKTSDSGADLEILHSKRVLTASHTEVWTENFVEAKVYTKKGIEQTSILHIEYLKKYKIWDMAARVVKPDGKSVELGQNDFIAGTLAKSKDFDLKLTSFAFRNLEPGDVIEYQWKEGEGVPFAFISWSWYYCQADVPIRDYEFDVKNSPRDFDILWFNLPKADLVKSGKSKQADVSLHIRNQPAFVEEPDMPAQRDFRGWICVAYKNPYLRLVSSDDMWYDLGSYKAEAFRIATDPTSAIKKLADEIAGAAVTPEEKLRLLCAYCQEKLTNYDWVKTPESMQAREKREKQEEAQGASETFNKHGGKPEDINRAFGALARALNFQVRDAMSASRQDFNNVKFDKGWMFMDRDSVAVKVNDKWKMYSPGDYLSAPGALSIKEEDTDFFVCDENKSWYERGPVALPDQSKIMRKGRFTLDADGTLDGQIEITMNGHAGESLKAKWWDEGEAEATKSITEKVVSRVPGTEINDFHWTNLNNGKLPVVLSYSVHIPGYAEAAGSRLILTPSFFEAGAPARFVQGTRTFPVDFEFASVTRDDIEIVLPDGYALDAPNMPKNVGNLHDIFSAQYGVQYRPKSRTLVYQRNQISGNGGNLAFQSKSYPTIKSIFDDINHSDRQSFILKEKVASTAPTTPGTKVTAEK